MIIEIEKLKSNIYDLYTQNLLHLQNIMHFRFPALMTPILGRTIRYYEGLVMHKNFSRKLRPDDLIKSEQELEAKKVPHSFKPKNKLLYLVYADNVNSDENTSRS